MRRGRRARGSAQDANGGLAAWARATSGVVALLLAVQVWTGALLAFYYVPSAEAAHATVAYVEKVVPAGSWVRALHFHGSQWLPLALFLHLLQLFWRRAYERRRFAWLASVALLALVMANGATGYSLPWDARAFFSTRVAAGIASGLPLVGDAARAWLLGGADLSTLTLSRLNALHALVVPFLILLVVFARIYLLHPARSTRPGDGPDGATPREPSSLHTEQPTRGDDAQHAQRDRAARLARNAVAAGVVFLALSLVAWRWPAPLGPAAGEAGPGYLPRPGAQFLWLFQLLKYFPPSLASLAALLLPAALLCALAALPFLRRPRDAGHAARDTRRLVGASAFALAGLLVAALTAAAYVEDARDPRVREQLARQAREEDEFRRAPFVPRRLATDSRADANVETQTAPSAETDARAAATTGATAAAPPPASYVGHCARCHGAAGEGRGINPPLVGVSRRPRRTVEDLVRIIKNPRAYDLGKRMPSFAGKLSEDEMRAVAEWVASL